MLILTKDVLLFFFDSLNTRTPKGMFLEVFCDIKPTKKHSFGCLGVFLFLFLPKKNTSVDRRSFGALLFGMAGHSSSGRTRPGAVFFFVGRLGDPFERLSG